ncbi:hypothetical protein Plhal304r1_c024g0082981 [Plasmopara halstedii]
MRRGQHRVKISNLLSSETAKAISISQWVVASVNLYREKFFFQNAWSRMRARRCAEHFNLHLPIESAPLKAFTRELFSQSRQEMRYVHVDFGFAISKSFLQCCLSTTFAGPYCPLIQICPPSR